jgi:hypothetical protein
MGVVIQFSFYAQQLLVATVMLLPHYWGTIASTVLKTRL